MDELHKEFTKMKFKNWLVNEFETGTDPTVMQPILLLFSL